MDLLNRVVALFQAHGYWIVFFGVMLENAGLPVPGETILLAAGFCASQGTFSLAAVIGLGTLGAITGDNSSYWIGRELGRDFLLRYGKYFLLTQDRFHRIELFFEKHGDKTVLVARFLTGFRVFTALFAGAAHMRWSRFLPFNVIGAVLWATCIGLLGYFFGENWGVLVHWVNRTSLALVIAVVALVLVRWAFKRRRQS